MKLPRRCFDRAGVPRALLLCGLVVLVASCRTTPLDNIWPGCCPPPCPPQPAPCPPACPPAPAPCPPVVGVPTTVVIDERVSPIVDCNPIRTQHTLVATVLDQCGNPLPGQRVEWILSRYPGAVGDIVAVDDQYRVGYVAPLTCAYPGNSGNKIDNQYAVSVTNYGPELIDAGNNYPYTSANGARLPDITVGCGQSWLTITSTREGVTDLIVYVPGIRDGTRHKVWAKKVWADYDVEFPEDAINTLPEATHALPVKIVRTDGSGIVGQPVEAEILDGPGAAFESSSGQVAELLTNANGIAEFRLRNTSGQTGVNRVKLTAKGTFYGEVCPRSRIVTKRWQQVQLEVTCQFSCGASGVVGKPFDKLITVTNTGDAPAEGVVLEDAPQAGLNIGDGTIFPMNLGTLGPGQSITRTIQMVSNTAGTYTNTVTVRESDGTGEAQTSCAVEILQGALEITKVCNPPTVSAGKEVRFVVTVTNVGRCPVDNVVVIDEFPDGIQPTSQNQANLGTMAPGDRQEIIFGGIAQKPGTYTNVARATGDMVPEETAQCELKVVQCALEMDLIGPESIYFGENANFTLKVTNVGDGEAENCVVRVTYGGCLGGGFADFNIGPLAPGETWTQDFTQIARSVGPCTVRADSNCGGSCEMSGEAVVRVTGLTALQVEMVDKNLDGSEAGVFRVGETFIYQMRVMNDVGTERTPELVVSWDLPPELEFVSGRALRGGIEVTGSGSEARSGAFSMGVGGSIDFEIQVRVLSAPASTLVKTVATVTRASDGAELALESESTTLQP